MRSLQIPARMVAIGALALCAGVAVAQIAVIGQNQFSGNEVWRAAQGPGGPEQFISLNSVRGGTANTVLTAVTGSFTVGAASANFTLASGSSAAATSDGGNVIITAQPSAATITLPASPVPDGSIVGVCNGTNSAFATNVVTVAANTSQTLVPTGANITLTTLAADTCFKYQWVQANTSWYRVQ